MTFALSERPIVSLPKTRPTPYPHVCREVEYGVATVYVTPDPTDVIKRLLDVLTGNPTAWESVVSYRTNLLAERSLYDLTTDGRVIDAITFSLTTMEAEDLAEALHEAASIEACCECSNVAEVGPYCPQCADAL